MKLSGCTYMDTISTLRFFRSFLGGRALCHFIESEKWLLTTNPIRPIYVQLTFRNCHINSPYPIAMCVQYFTMIVDPSGTDIYVGPDLGTSGLPVNSI